MGRKDAEDNPRRHNAHNRISRKEAGRKRLGDVFEGVAVYAPHAMALRQVGDASEFVPEPEGQQGPPGSKGKVAYGPVMVSGTEAP